MNADGRANNRRYSVYLPEEIDKRLQQHRAWVESKARPGFVWNMNRFTRTVIEDALKRYEQDRE